MVVGISAPATPDEACRPRPAGLRVGGTGDGIGPAVDGPYGPSAYRDSRDPASSRWSLDRRAAHGSARAARQLVEPGGRAALHAMVLHTDGTPLHLTPRAGRHRLRLHG